MGEGAVNVIEAVRQLRDAGGCIRRPHWKPDEYVTLGPGSGDFTFHYLVNRDKPHAYKTQGHARVRPRADDLLAEDWAWQAALPVTTQPLEAVPALAWESTIELPASMFDDPVKIWWPR